MKNWVFDLDGTLVDSFRHYFISLEEIFADHGRVFNDSLHMAALTGRLENFFADHLGSSAVEPAMTKLYARSNDDARNIRPFEGVSSALEDLRARGARVAVWTNRELVSAELILKHSGLSRFVEVCISGTCVKKHKPDPEGILRLIERFGCEPEDVTMVGDHEHDVVAAKSVGARAVRASWHSYWRMDPCPSADAQFHRFDEFAEWIKREPVRETSLASVQG